LDVLKSSLVDLS